MNADRAPQLKAAVMLLSVLMKTRAILKGILLTPAMGVLAVFLVPACLWILADWSLANPSPERGKSYEVWEPSNQTFKVRATAYHEVGIYLPGAYFAFESAAIGSDDWKEFAIFRADDPLSIPREQFRFLNNQTAYVYMADAYVVTVNGGQSWSVWKPVLPLTNGQSAHWAIKELIVGPEGVGAAKLWRYDEQVKDIVNLEVRTQDYGLHWSGI